MAYKLIIVGAGRMGSALAEGLLDANWCARQELAMLARSVETRHGARAALSRRRGRRRWWNSRTSTTHRRVLCVKPDHAEAVARTAGALGVTRLLSVVAGLSTARIEAAFARPVAVIRSMPNTPVLVRKGVSAMAGGAHVTEADLDWAESILGAVGTVVRVAERNIDAVTGLSGPMPAYLYLVVEALIEAGVHQGLAARRGAPASWSTPSTDRRRC